jgi:hypothetical protein
MRVPPPAKPHPSAGAAVRVSSVAQRRRRLPGLVEFALDLVNQLTVELEQLAQKRNDEEQVLRAVGEIIRRPL